MLFFTIAMILMPRGGDPGLFSFRNTSCLIVLSTLWMMSSNATADAVFNGVPPEQALGRICGRGSNQSNSLHHFHAVVGRPGKKNSVDRVMRIVVDDNMRFIPDRIGAKQGETIRFIVRNVGHVSHEMVFGTQRELKTHYKQMMQRPSMVHADPQMVTVEPGKIGEIVWQFTKSGKIDFACLQPGHYDAGMKGNVFVTTPVP
jgi:uncharacterized cupredoxin-like copper-binding protein